MKQYIATPIHNWLNSNGYYGAAIGFMTSFWTGIFHFMTVDNLIKCCITIPAGIFGLIAAAYTALIKHREYHNFKKNDQPEL
jgi:hypothetical protein